VAVLKKKLVAVSAALGEPPAGYAMDDEQFSLPTEADRQKSTGKFHWVYASVTQRFAGGGEKKAKKTQAQLQQDYERKAAEAMAKGDYEAIARLGQEMQQEAGKAHLAEIEGKKIPIEVRIVLNTSQYQGIDPDRVVFEKQGVIALLLDAKDEARNRIAVYFDPVALMETKTLSRIEIRQPEGGTAKKTVVQCATVELVGPAAEITAWAKRMNTGAVLAQIDKY
jgi:hypothetical protein